MSQLSYYLEMTKRISSWRTVPRIWNYLKYRCLKRKTTLSTKRYKPQIAIVSLTMRCNLDCTYCLAAKNINKAKDSWQETEATLEKVQRIFANPLFADCLLVNLQGGEPLLVKDLDRIIVYLRKRGHVTNISTNGLLLVNRIQDLKRAGISRINVSLYDANRSFIEHNLVNINKIFPVHMSIVLLRSMVEREQDKLLETARFIHDAGCRSISFWIYRPMGTNPQPDEIIKDNNLAYIEFRRRMEELLPGFCLWPATVKTEGARKRCSQLWQHVACNASGNVAICCGTDMMLQGAHSNLFDGEPDLILNHPTLVAMRKQLLDPECEPPDICKTCSLLEHPGW